MRDGDEFIEVPEEETIKGYEHAKGQHVLIDPKELDELKLEAKHTIDMVRADNTYTARGLQALGVTQTPLLAQRAQRYRSLSQRLITEGAIRK